MNWVSIAMLVVQAGLAIVAIEQLRHRVLPNLDRVAQPELMLEVWVPLALVLPLLFGISRVESNVRGAGWLAVGAPALCAIVAVALAMVVSGRGAAGEGAGEHRRELFASAGAGVFLLLLSAANELSLLAGQCAFAIGAVLVWL